MSDSDADSGRSSRPPARPPALPPALPPAAGPRPRVAVVGAGVIGLTAAIRLLERGLADVTVLAREDRGITSDAAGAFWYPFAAGPRDKVAAWSAATFARLRELATDPATGVRPIRLRQFYDGPLPDPSWFADPVDDLAEIPPRECHRPWTGGWTFTTWLMDTTIAMPWLRSRLDDLGGRLVAGPAGTVREVADLAGDFDACIFAPGVDAARIAVGGRRDARCRPIRGQVIRARRPDGVDPDTIVETVVTYVIPRADDLILGGTAEDGDWSLEPSLDTAADILERCRRLVPQLPEELDELEILEHRVGLRPGRDEIRLEVEVLDTARGRLPVVHDHGHGGAGWTLSWGCADEAADLVAAAVGAPSARP